MLAISNRELNAATCVAMFLIKHGADVHIQNKDHNPLCCSTLPQGIPL